ncbi:MAG: hypothetical protein CM15mP46_6720 [Alphaproteobacteria bacterium]|nr:MAG: hypothetical protein CM15mP46_6720 [Alphaproteobacteria bacterium]
MFGCPLWIICFAIETGKYFQSKMRESVIAALSLLQSDGGHGRIIEWGFIPQVGLFRPLPAIKKSPDRTFSPRGACGLAISIVWTGGKDPRDLASPCGDFVKRLAARHLRSPPFRRLTLVTVAPHPKNPASFRALGEMRLRREAPG